MAEQHKVGNCKDSVGYCVALPPCNAVAAAAAGENTGRKYLSRRPPGQVHLDAVFGSAR